jgi:ATP-binding protein involved in chromosome partitioning
MNQAEQLAAALAAHPALKQRAAPPRFAAGIASIVLDATGLSSDERAALQSAAETIMRQVEGVTNVRVAMTIARTERALIAVASGKGGVGKSTVAANLAVALARQGAAVGLVDADIYGPSQARLLNTEGQKPQAIDKKLIPIQSEFSVPMLSMAHLVEPGRAIAWRGPMAANAMKQMIDADWGTATILIVDMPPGTGDIQLSMLQQNKPAGAVIVSTPQDLSLIDATRAIDLFNAAGVPILGLIENMAGYACPACGTVSNPFGAGGAEQAATALKIPFLGQISLEMSIRMASDAGKPPASVAGETVFSTLAQKVSDALYAARASPQL